MAENKSWKQKLLGTDCEEKAAKGLGFFSLGLGLAELLAPRAVAWICGVESRNANLIRLYGLRELQAGALIFAQGRKPAQAIWLRVAGDAIDIASLGMAFFSPKSCRARLSLASASVLAVTALDVWTARKLSRSKGWTTDDGRVRVNQSIFINRQPRECYEYWRKLDNLPSFMRHLISVTMQDNDRSSWVAKGPAGARVAWDAEIVEDRAGESIVWRSLPGSIVGNRGSVKFEPAPGGRGTYLIVELQYDPPAGMVGVGVAKLFREEPKMQLKDDLRRFKQIMEVGEIVRSDASPEGNGNLRQRSAQPMPN